MKLVVESGGVLLIKLVNEKEFKLKNKEKIKKSNLNFIELYLVKCKIKFFGI